MCETEKAGNPSTIRLDDQHDSAAVTLHADCSWNVD